MSKNPWIEHIKNYAKEKNISYSKAIKMPDCKASYVGRVISTAPGDEVAQSIKGEGVFSGEAFNPLAYIKDRKQKLERTIKTIKGERFLPAKVDKIVGKYANKNITGIKLHRTPLGKTLMTVLNLASGNTLKDKIANSAYDKLFHLFMCIETSDGSFSIEKNEVINANASCKLPPYTETRVINTVPEGLTVEQSLENTKAKLGDKFLSYSASNNNCQHFITAFLEANKIGDSSDISFVKQDTENLFEGNPTFRKIVNSVTNLGTVFSNITGGELDDETDPCWKGYTQIGMKKKRGKKVPNCVPDDMPIDYKKMKWGSLTRQMNAYNSKHSKKLDLYHFSKHIIKNPKDYTPTTVHRANFYINVIRGKGLTDIIKKIGETAGKPYEISGVNPFKLGFDLGEKVIAPELMKVLPPEKVKKSFGGKISNDNKMKKANPWIQHVKQFAQQQNMKYSQALKDPACKLSYGKVGSGMPTSDEAIIAENYDSSKLGARTGGL